jgi:transposase
MPVLRKKNCQESQGLRWSRSGLSTKVHAVCDAFERPIRFIVTPGNINDCTQAVELIEGFDVSAVLADKGYDTDEVIAAIESSGAVAVIPPKSNRKIQRKYDKELYKERHKVECLFGFLKHFRMLFSRFDKMKINLSAFLHFVAAL